MEKLIERNCPGGTPIYTDSIDYGDFLALQYLKDKYDSANILYECCFMVDNNPETYKVVMPEYKAWELGDAITVDNGYDLNNYGWFYGSVPCTSEAVEALVYAISQEVV